MSIQSNLLEKISEKGYIILNNFDSDLACFRNEIEQKYLKSLIDNNISHIDIENIMKLILMTRLIKIYGLEKIEILIMN